MPAQSGQEDTQQWARKAGQGKAEHGKGKGKGIRRSGSAAAQMPTVWLAEPGCRVLERIVYVMRTDPPAKERELAAAWQPQPAER